MPYTWDVENSIGFHNKKLEIKENNSSSTYFPLFSIENEMIGIGHSDFHKLN